jgi:pyruvate ferredoxin oxidoreductase alpha subunit
MYGQQDAPAVLASYIGGLGGRDISNEEFFQIAQELADHVKQGTTPQPRLLYTAEEMREMRKLQALARAERDQLGGRHDGA